MTADTPRLLRFDAFMREALYHPEWGYYTAGVRSLGRRGDFSTGATLGRELGRAVARWAEAARRDLGLGRRWHLIELGGGTGDLAAAVLDGLGRWRRLGLTYHLVDISRSLRPRQEERLAGRRVRWHATVQEALAASGGRAVIFGNEFVDAFPCRILRATAAGFEELWIEETAPKEHREVFRAAGDLDAAGFSSLRRPWPDGQRLEIQPDFRSWLAGLSAAAERAALLLVDYGETADVLGVDRPGGTVRAYCQQTRLTGAEIYKRVGRQDLTVDVNFTDLQEWAAADGWRVAGYGTQAAFLDHLLGPPDAQAAADLFLRDEAGAGAAFKVLDLRRVAAGRPPGS